MVTATQVRAIAKTLGASPRADLVDAIVRGWDDAAVYAKLSTRKRAAAFLGQIMTETGGLQILVESGAYRFETICKIFGEPGISKKYGGRGHSAKVTEAEARSIAALPVAKRGPRLFNRVYGVGNPSKVKEFKNTGPNDGWLYRGGGMMQTTGKSNYADKARKTGLPLVEHPELLQQPDPAFKAAYLEWGQDARANRTADAIGGTGAALKASLAANRRVINGGTNGLEHFIAFYAKALEILKGYDAVPIAPVFQEPELEEEEPATVTLDPATWNEPEPEAAPNVQPLEDPEAVGDPVLFNVQRRLKERRYSPGVLDGRWGSGTSGALGGYRNDRGIDFPMPRNLEQFHDVADVIRLDLANAEAEGWFRPVSEARAAAKPEIVKELAPETVPVKRNFIASAWAAFLALIGSIWETVSGYVGQAWDFFTDHKDVVDDHPGVLSTVWSYVLAVPTSVWLLAAAAGLAFIAINSRQAIKTSEQAVATGERQ